MARPRIGLTTYGRDDRNWFELPADYVDAIRRAGGRPVLLPPGEVDVLDWFEDIDALVLTGGGDMCPATHGGAPHETNYKMDAVRDHDEVAMARHVVAARFPTLAICRGMQVLNAAFGGSILAHLPDVVGDAVAHRTADRKPVAHTVVVEPASRLARVMGATEVTTASWHHQGLGELAAEFVAVARAADGTVEAIECPAHPGLLAVQWHPEITAAEDPTQQRIFDALVQSVPR